MNTPRKAEPTEAEIRALAAECGIDADRLRFFDDLDVPELAAYTQLTDVRLRSAAEPEWGIYLAESTKIIRRALATGHEPRSFLMSRKWFAGMTDILTETTGPIYLGTEARIADLTGFHLHRGALAAMARPAPRTAAEVVAEVLDAGAPRCRVAVFEGLVDHTNVGAAFRSAAALGVDAVLVTPECADPLYRRSIRVSMGTVFQIPWTRIDPWPAGIDLLKDSGFYVAGMSLGEGAITLDELVAAEHERLALVFGTEGDGLKRGTDSRLDARVTIPMMHGVDSLNVAASSAVAFYATK